MSLTGLDGVVAASGGDGHRTLLRNAVVLSMDPDVGDFEAGDVLIEGSSILAVGEALQADAAEVDCSGCIVMPGFVNSHHHTFQTALRSYWTDALAVDYFTASRQGERAVFHVYEPSDVYWGEYAGALEQLNAGTTTVVDTSQCTATPQHTDAAIEGLIHSGVRAVYAYSPKAHGSTPRPEYAFPQDVRRIREQFFASNDQLVTLAFGSPALLVNWKLARELNLPIFSHVNDVGAGLQVEQLSKVGLAGSWNTYIHCTGLAESTWQMFAETGGKVSLSSVVEQTLCTGMPGMQAAMDHGIQPSFSTDAVSLGPTDFFSQIRAAYALQRSRLQERAIAGESPIPDYLSTRDILRMATIEGARAAHLDHKVGSLTPGKQADVLVLNTKTLNAAPLNHASGAVVALMDTSNVRTVIVAGKIVKWEGELVGVDVGHVVNELEKSATGLLERSEYPNLLLTSCRS